MPTVPEAAEYETTDNTSSSSTLQEEVNNIESEYHIEHGRVFSSAVSSNTLYQVLIYFRKIEVGKKVFLIRFQK